MDRVKARERYRSLTRDELINILISSREEIQKLKNSEKSFIIENQDRKIKAALKFIDSYTAGRKYMTKNDEELIDILEKKNYWR